MHSSGPLRGCRPVLRRLCAAHNNCKTNAVVLWPVWYVVRGVVLWQHGVWAGALACVVRGDMHGGVGVEVCGAICHVHTHMHCTYIRGVRV